MGTMDETRTLELQFNGRKVAATSLTAGQIKVIQMSSSGGSNDQLIKSEHRLFRIIEKSLGESEWSNVMDDMASGDVSLEAFHDYLRDLIVASVKSLTEVATPNIPAADPKADPNSPLGETEVEALERRLALLRGAVSE